MSYRLRDIVNPKKWYAFVVGHLLKKTITISYAEQFLDRTNKCAPCVAAGECEHCGCPMPAAAIPKGNSCSRGAWGPMMNDSDWNDWKEIYDIKFK